MQSLILLFITCLAICHAEDQMVCRIKAVEDKGGVVDPNREMCAYKAFEGPVGTIIATLEPTRLARYAEDNAKDLVSNMASFFTLVPVAGAALEVAFGKFEEFGFDDEGAIIDSIIDDIEKQLNSLKKYVDNKVQQHEHTILTHDLEGFFAIAKSCTDYDKEDQIKDLERCLITFNTRVVGAVGRFTPDTDDIISYDWILPLFRQYGDLQLTITQDLLNVAMRLKKESAQEDYVKRLKEQANEFYEFVVKAIDRIVYVKTNFPSKTCTANIKWSSRWNPFASFQGYIGSCTQVFFHNRVCKEDQTIKSAKNGIIGRQRVRNKAGQCLDGYAANVKRNLEKDLRKYWKAEMLDIAKIWKTIGERAEKMIKKLEKKKKKKTKSD